jgi:EF hand
MARLLAGLVAATLALTQGAQAEETALDRAMRKNPNRFADQVIDLIAGFGGADGLRPAGIEEHIALERAGARASALRRFLAMDLDGDGAVVRAELAVSQRAASAAGRGRLERSFAAADANADGRIDTAELQAAGKVAALQGLSETEAEVLRALMSLDSNGDGALHPDELRAALARAGEAT